LYRCISIFIEIHVCRNVTDKLCKCNVPSQLSTEILDDVFGKKLGTEYVEGLADAEDADDFDAKLESLIPQWKGKDTATTCLRDVDSFIN